MSSQEWLSLSEIARRWSEETGENAETLERDLQAWFSALVEGAPDRSSESPAGAGDTTNLLMGWLGGRHLKRDTLARYCEERDRARPRFWFAENGEDLPETVPGAAPVPEPVTTETTATEPMATEPAAMAPAAAEGTALGPVPADQTAPTARSVPRDPDGLLEAIPEPVPPRPAARRTAPEASARPAAATGRFGPPAVRLAGGIGIGLALLAVGYFIGHGSSGAPTTAQQAGQTDAAPELVAAAPVSELRDDLVAARRQIDTLGAALEASETEVRQLKRDLKRTHQALDTARQMARQTARPAAQASAPADGASNGPAASDVAALKADLAGARQTIDDLRAAAPEDTQSEAIKRSLIEAAASASSQAMAYKAELRDAREQIAALQRDAQIAKAAADALSAELKEARQQQAAAQAAPAQRDPAQAEAARQRAILAAQIAGAQADLSKQELATVRTRLARAESEAEAAKAEAARLAGKLADQRQREAVALGTATVANEGARRELRLAAQSASVHAARLGKDLAAARRQIADLEAEARAARAEAVGLAAQLADARRQKTESLDRLRAEAVARQRELDDARDRIASLQAARRPSDDVGPGPTDQPVEAQSGSNTVRRTVAGPVRTSTRQVARPSGQPLDLLDSGTDQEVAHRLVRRPAPLVSSAPAEAIDVDVLVADPGRYDARRVVVTGSLMRLLQHYRLQSQSGVQTLVVDVEGLDRDQYDQLRKAIADAGLIGSVEAQISGTVERGAAESFRLVASDLKLID